MSNIKSYKGTYDYRIDYCNRKLHLTIGFDMNPDPTATTPNLAKYIFTPIDLDFVLSTLHEKAKENKASGNEEAPKVSISRNLSVCSEAEGGGYDPWKSSGQCSFVKTIVEFSQNGSCGLFFLVEFNPTKNRANGGSIRQRDTIHSVYLDLRGIADPEQYNQNGCTSSPECKDICEEISNKISEFDSSSSIISKPEGQDEILALELAQHDDGEVQYVKKISILNNLLDQYYAWYIAYTEYKQGIEDTINQRIDELEREHDGPGSYELIQRKVVEFLEQYNPVWNLNLQKILANYDLVAKYLITHYPSNGWGDGQDQTPIEWNPGAHNINNLTMFDPSDVEKAKQYMGRYNPPQVNIDDYMLQDHTEDLEDAHSLVESSVIVLNKFWNNCDTDAVGNLRMTAEIDLKQSINNISDELKGKCTLYAFPNDISGIPCVNLSGVGNTEGADTFDGLKLPCPEDI